MTSHSKGAVQQLEFCTLYDGEGQGKMTQPCAAVCGGMEEVPRNWMLALREGSRLLKQDTARELETGRFGPESL